jgi:phenylacetate-CoA ligase
MKRDIDIIKDILRLFEESQWKHKPNFDLVKNLPILTRSELQKMPMKKGLFSCRSSGSTGEPVIVQKYMQDYCWYNATNLRELKWRNWDVSKNIAIIKPVYKSFATEHNWGFPKEIFPNQGIVYKIGFEPIPSIRALIEYANPHYIHSYPSIIKQLDLTKITNFIDAKSTGELGGTMYSSEECGTIAISCPDNPQNYHVMENQIVEKDDEGNAIITTLTNPYIKKYKNGDVIELGECGCGRTLQTITKIHGRVRNLFTMPDGRKKWPLVASITYYEKYGITRFKAIQHAINELELQVIKTREFEENNLIDDVRNALGVEIKTRITYVNDFKNYKHEEFVSLIT